ncbi:hypothetical protein TanjilG_31528 [Lupinus angustifolius]|uniref:Bet v I/Major latex protein domain-containing protein n=1 Tax=Lupinus angustifolius TaxID=3871 RepID=A0A4P1RUD6_LUPAN|nr:hypothetical protein TanjilG_31528 [Lupinus angustifolius]
MGVFTFENESTSTVAPARLYKALVTDADIIIPKAVDTIQSVETVEGNGGPGTIKKLTLVEDTVEKISIETKLFEGPNGGSIGKVTINIQTKGDAQPNEEEGKAAKARGDVFFKAIESYLSAHPEYN